MAASFERRCTYCGRPESEVGRLSARGRCRADAEAVQLANTEQMRERHGPLYEHWLERTEAGIAAARDALEREGWAGSA